jgi:hypothetical protein
LLALRRHIPLSAYVRISFGIIMLVNASSRSVWSFRGLYGIWVAYRSEFWFCRTRNSRWPLAAVKPQRLRGATLLSPSSRSRRPASPPYFDFSSSLLGLCLNQATGNPSTI